MEYIYGFNDSGVNGCGTVHIFLNKHTYEMRMPLCGKRQHYTPANCGETPRCKLCQKIADKMEVK